MHSCTGERMPAGASQGVRSPRRAGPARAALHRTIPDSAAASSASSCLYCAAASASAPSRSCTAARWSTIQRSASARSADAVAAGRHRARQPNIVTKGAAAEWPAGMQAFSQRRHSRRRRGPPPFSLTRLPVLQRGGQRGGRLCRQPQLLHQRNLGGQHRGARVPGSILYSLHRRTHTRGRCRDGGHVLGRAWLQGGRPGTALQRPQQAHALMTTHLPTSAAVPAAHCRTPPPAARAAAAPRAQSWRPPPP